MTPASNAKEAYQRALLPSTILTPRNFTVAMQAVTLAFWIGPLALLWFAAMQFLEMWVNPRLVARFVTPHVKSDQKRARFNGSLIIAGGILVHVTGWAPAWWIAGPDASILGVVYLISAIVSALTYFSYSRVQFIACIAPALLICIIITIAQHTIEPWALLAATAAVVSTTFVGFRERNLLSAALVKSKADRQAALQSDKAKTQFLATMSHELRTPLNAIIGYAEIIQEDMEKGRYLDSAADAARVKRAAHHLLGLITEILDFSKIEAGRVTVTLSDMDVNEIISEVVETTKHLAEMNGNKIAVNGAATLPHVVTDAGKVRQCLLNLVSNACKFTTNGNVDIDVRLDAQRVLHIAVTDNGCGIAPEQALRLFQPFVQVDGSLTRQRQGTGLGLVITKRLAELLGGDVVIKSTLGVGSTFTMTIRTHDWQALATPEPANANYPRAEERPALSA